MFCIRCGSEIKEGTCFCPKCGERIESQIEPSSKSLEGDVLKNEGKSDENIVKCVNVSSPETGWSGETQNEKKGTGKKINWNSGIANIAIVIGIVLLLVGTACRPEEEKQGMANVAANSNEPVSGENTDITSNVNNTINEQPNILDREEESELERKSATIKTQVLYSVLDNQNYWEIEYDKYGNVISRIQNTSEEFIEEHSYEYSTDGQIITDYKKVYDENGILTQERQSYHYYNYDDNGNIILKDVCYEVSGNLKRIQAVRYDYSDAGKRMGCKTENYDENGNVKSEEYSVWNEAEEKYKITYDIYYYNFYYDETMCIYDENGNISQRIDRFEGSKTECTKYRYVYDNLGNPIEGYMIYCENGEILDYYYIYEYDSMGNILVEYQYFDFEAYKNADKDNARYITYYTYYE